jgi:ribosomal protein L37E
VGRSKVSNADWWSKQLGTQSQVPQQPRQINNPTPPTQQPMTPYVAPQQQPPSAAKAQSASQTQTCPECGGNNYMSPQPTIALRCYDCGYPISQSGSRYGALTGAKVEGSAKNAIGNDVRSNFNPMPDGYNSQGQKI